MRDIDFPFLFAFIKRAGMYIGSGEDCGYKGVGTFIYAYEAGSAGLCNFSSHLIKKISDKYEVEPHNGGIENQLKEAAVKKGIEWYILFQEAANETLVDLSDVDGKNIFVNQLRNSIISNLEKIGDSVNPYLVRINWRHIIEQIEDWKGVNLTSEEKTKFLSLMQKLTNLSDMTYSDADIKITNEIISEITELMNLVKCDSHSYK